MRQLEYGPLLTKRVNAAKEELLDAVREALSESGGGEESEAALTCLYCDLWNASERMLNTIPGDKRREPH